MSPETPVAVLEAQGFSVEVRRGLPYDGRDGLFLGRLGRTGRGA